VRLLAGGLADEALGSAKVLPRVLEKDGYAFRHPELPGALTAALG
jgi:NAD dependent epimerase/dehydratase family enzyme